MKYGFLTSKTSITIVGLIIGLYGGFKIANSQYRLTLERDLKTSIAGATRSTGAASGGAIEETRRVIDKAKSNPADIEAQLDAADQFMQISRPDEALPFLQRAHQIDQQDPRALAGLGMASFLSGKYEEAIKWASQSLEVRPGNPGASFLLIASYIRTNQKLYVAERMIGDLEKSGVDPNMITSIRDELNSARGTKSSTKTMLDHGPSETKPGAPK
ncbi:MAG: tetratricopeptide repeat protein [Acidobacteriota bacterium]